MLTVFDDNGTHPAGIPVEVGGKRLVSDAEGVVHFTAPPGAYSARVLEGCSQDVFVLRGGTARFGLVEDETTRGDILARWQHRYAPAPPVSASVVGSWPIGRSVDVSYAVTDHCEGTRAKNATFGWFALDASANLEIVGTPVMRSDEKGVARFRVKCSDRGNVGLTLRDRDDPSVSFDVDAHLSGYRGPPSCA